MHGEPVVIADFGLRIVLMEKVFINSKSEIRNRQSAIKGPSVSLWLDRTYCRCRVSV